MGGAYKRYKLTDKVYHLQRRGDISEIGRQNNIKYQNIARAFKNGSCTKNIYEAIINFYRL